MKPFAAARRLASAPGSIKRLGYIFGLGGAVLALLLAVPLELASGQANSFDTYALPLTAAVLMVLMLAFVRAKAGIQHLEILTFLVLTTFFTVELVLALYGPAIDASAINSHLAEFGFWFPTLYASVLFILGVDHGWRIAAGHLGLSVLVGLPFAIVQLTGGGAFNVVYSLTQLYLSSAVAIATVIIFVRYTESVVRAKTEMEQLAHTDHVTRLGNRRQMEKLLLQEVRRSERYGNVMSLLLLDLDHFKRVNDLHGHPVGDEVLREISALLLAESRTSDHIGRWGGEEFIVILPNTGRENALLLAERVVERVDQHVFARVGHVTVSIGGSCLGPGEQPDSLISRADEALYRAKAGGRNCVVVSDPLTDATAQEPPPGRTEVAGRSDA